MTEQAASPLTLTAMRAFPHHLDHDALEHALACIVVADALSRGYMLSVYEGEGWAIKRSTDAAAIMEALGSTDSDLITARTADGERVGSVWLIYGNGCDLISDSTDTPAVDLWLSAATAYAEANA